MEGEVRIFRRSLFGGFNRDDVVAYIALLSKERNEAVASAEKAEAEKSKLQEELKALHKKIDIYEQLINKYNELKDSKQTKIAPQPQLPQQSQQPSQPPQPPQQSLQPPQTQPQSPQQQTQSEKQVKPVIIIKRRRSKNGNIPRKDSSSFN